MVKQCPKCGQIAAQIMDRADREGRNRTVCSTCGWEGPSCFGEKWEAHNVKCVGGNDKTFWDGSSHKRPQCGVYQPCAAEMNRQKIQGLPQSFLPVIQQGQPVPLQLPQAPQAPQVPPQVQPQPVAVPYTPSVTVPMPDGSRKTLTLAQPSSIQPHVPVAQRSVQVRPPSLPGPVIPQMHTQPIQVATATPGQVQPMMYQTHYNGQPMMVMMVPPEQAQIPALVPQNVVQPGTQVLAVMTVPEPATLPYFKRFIGSVGRSMLKYGFLSAANMMDHVPWWSE